MKLSEELQWRGFINQMTFDNMTALDDAPLNFYFGVDPSSDSMTIGNLAAAMMVRHLIEAGHNAHLLVGGATGLIGDPDGKSEERSQKSQDEVEKNKRGIAQQYQQVFNGQQFRMVDNYDWFRDINYLEFLREIGKHVPMGQMLGRDFVQSRLGDGGAGISYAEFSYSLIQGYDFLHLFREYGVTLQVCGADQWGNAIAGVDLIRRIEGSKVDVYSTPLVINKATGKKFGKSEDGAIWLDERKTSVYQFYQFWLNVDDVGAVDYLKVYTLLSKDEIDDLARRQAANASARTAQKTLAYEVTALVHGQDRAESAVNVTRVLFGEDTLSSLDDEGIALLSREIPTAATGGTVIAALTKSGVVSSRGEARRLIENGAITINEEKLMQDRTIDQLSLIKKGRNTFLLVK